MEKLNHFEADIWGIHHIEWKDINPDVNIIVGVNGTGKTTLLDSIYDKVNEDCIYIRSIDNIAMRDKRRQTKANALTQELENYFYNGKTGPSLVKNRSDYYSLPDAQKTKISEYEGLYQSVVNEFFAETGKVIDLREFSQPVVINGQYYPLSILSSGEKQLMLMLLQVALLMGREALVLIDEPESYLHISWQSELINVLTELNPKAQYIITTHSPSIFGDGWGDKVVYMDQIIFRE